MCVDVWRERTCGWTEGVIPADRKGELPPGERRGGRRRGVDDVNYGRSKRLCRRRRRLRGFQKK